MQNHLLKISLPMATPPWTGLGQKIESMCRKAVYDFNLLSNVDHLAVALSGGKDSLALLFMLHALSGRGFQKFSITAIHISGEFSCGPGIHTSYLAKICESLGVSFIQKESKQKKDNLQCYSCSRERRRLIFSAAKEACATTIAFGHHRDDSIQTLLMNLFHKAEFAANLPKVPMHDYGVTIIRPFIYVPERQILEFAKHYGFARITCQCPVGQNSLRKQTEKILSDLEETYPNIRENLSLASHNYASDKALKK